MTFEPFCLNPANEEMICVSDELLKAHLPEDVLLSGFADIFDPSLSDAEVVFDLAECFNPSIVEVTDDLEEVYCDRLEERASENFEMPFNIKMLRKKS